ERAQVCVRGERLAQAEFGGAAGQVVALDVSDLDGPRAEFTEPGGEAGGVEATGVDHQFDAALDGEFGAVRELGDERAGVAERPVLGLVAGEDEHGQLGQVVAGDDVGSAGLEQLAERFRAVAVEAGSVADADQGTPPGPVSVPAAPSTSTARYRACQELGAR